MAVATGPAGRRTRRLFAGDRPSHELDVGDAQVGDQQRCSVGGAPVPGGGVLGLAEGGGHLEQVLEFDQQAAPVGELHEHVGVVVPPGPGAGARDH